MVELFGTPDAADLHTFKDMHTKIKSNSDPFLIFCFRFF